MSCSHRMSLKSWISIMFMHSFIAMNGNVLDVMNHICRYSIFAEIAQEPRENEAMSTRIPPLLHQLSNKDKSICLKEHKYINMDYRELLVFSSLSDYCWECPTWRTSEPSKQVTVMRMWLKFVQLHLNTYIPASFPSCRSLLMAYSVLKESMYKWGKPTNEQLHPKSIISKYTGE